MSTEVFILFVGSLAAGLLALVLNPSDKVMKMSLAFAGAFILGLGFFHLLPDSYATLGATAGLWVVGGFLFQVVLEAFSGGLEHGHHHHHGKKFPWMVFAALSLHAFIEGMPFGHEQDHGHDSLLIGILLHKMPVAFVLAVMLKETTTKRWELILPLVMFSLMSPFGSLAYQTLPLADDAMMFSSIMAFVMGMLLHISTTVLFEADKGHKFNFLKLGIIAASLVFSYLVTLH
jgi:zinc transporter ZupT